LQYFKHRLAFGYYALRVWGLRRKTRVFSRGRALIAGLLSSPNGIGEGARLIRSGLSARGYDVSVFDLSPIIQPDLSNISVEPAEMDDETGPIILHVNPSEVPKAIYSLRGRNLKNRRIIGVWAWELERAPKYWSFCTGWFDEIWAISEFMAKAISELPVPVAHVGYPIEAAEKISLDWRKALNLEEDFIVLIAFDTRSSVARKNPLSAVEVFRKAFQDTQNVTLLVKISGQIEEKDRDALQAENIVLVEDSFTVADMTALITASDCHLSLSRAEGLGLVAAEAAANGIPVVITGWSGPAEWKESPNIHLVDFTLTDIADENKIYVSGTGLKWAEPDINDAVVKLRHVYEQSEEVRALAAEQARAWWRVHYSAEAFEARIPKRSLENFQKREL